MKDALIHLQVFFEIAMSIGNSLDLSKMLQNCLSTYLGKLNCSAGAVFEARKGDEDRYINELVFSIPRRIHMAPVFTAALHKIPPHFSKTDYAAFTGKLPIVLAEGNNYVSHILNLPGFGFLVLLKANTRLEDEILRATRPINQKLADSCHACMQNERINQLVNRLQAEIDERAKIEEALRESHDRFLTVMDSIDATVYVADIESHEILFMNRKMAENFGNNFEGELCHQVFRGNSAPCEHCTNPLLLDANGKSTGVHIWEDQNLIPGKWYINYDRAIKWVNGKWVRLQIATDITLLKELQKKQIKAEAQLLQSQKMESIGTLAGGIAHDFNNILASVIGYTELALDEVEKGTDIEDNLQEVHKAGKRAKDLVRQILAFARQSNEEIKPIQVAAIVNEVLKFIRSSIPTSIEIKQNIESDSLIMGNATQVHQILMNLLTNAAHAMEDEGGILELSLKDVVMDSSINREKLDLTPGNYIEIKVSDTGVGIAPEIIGSIFDPFFTTKGPGEGTGMGLATVHGIVESYGGKISVDSKPGQGTLIAIYLPITKKPQEQRPYQPELLPKGKERILFVDDEAPIAKMGGQVLERLGYTVSVRTSSLKALELFRSKPNDFDLVITDMTMPNMSGDNLAVELMKIRSDIPVILCTGYSKKISDDSATAIGIKAFAYKPVVKADLAKTVRKVLDDQQQEQTTGRILLIDDESAIRKLFIQKLAGRGYEIIEACDGKEGLRLYRENRPDLVITDLVMPEKEGIEMITELKKEFPNVRIIAISGGGRNTTDAYLQIAKTLGADRTFPKPIDWPELIKAVSGLLR